MLAELQQRILTCNKCPRLREVTPLPLAHICFNDKPSIMTIGRNPGLEHSYSHINIEELNDFYHKKWLISRYGKYLQKIFDLDFVKQHIFACNICKCSSPKNTNLEQEEINNCLEYLYEEINIINPKIILIFGSEAAKALVENFNYLKPFKFRNITTLVCRHPAYFLYARNEASEYHYEDQARALRSVRKFIEGV